MLQMYTHVTNALVGIRSSVVALVRDDESGATAIEYGLIAGGIAVAIIGIVFAIGNDISAFFQAIDTQLTARAPT